MGSIRQDRNNNHHQYGEHQDDEIQIGRGRKKVGEEKEADATHKECEAITISHLAPEAEVARSPPELRNKPTAQSFIIT
jgi:hypothetical protein